MADDKNDIQDWTNAAKREMAAHLPTLAQLLINKAHEGDMAALKMVFDKFIPNTKKEQTTYKVGNKDVVDQVKDGDITIETGHEILKLLNEASLLANSAEVEERISEFQTTIDNLIKGKK